MPFVWQNPQAKVNLTSAFDYKKSEYSDVDLMLYSGSHLHGRAVSNVHGCSINELRKWDVVVNNIGTLLISQKLRKFLEETVGSQLGLFPTLCHCRDGEVIGYSFAAPRRHVACVDLNRTEVTDWFVPNETILRYRSIALKENCIEPMGICRDTHIRQFTIIGEELARKLSDAEFKGLCFVKVEDAINPLGKG